MSIANFSDVLVLQDINFDIISFALSIFTFGIGNNGNYGIASLMYFVR